MVLGSGGREALGRQVLSALTRAGDLIHGLQGCAQAIVEHLDAAFARIWVLDEAERVLVLRASAGIYTHLDGAHATIPVGAAKIGWIAEQRQAHLSNDVPGDPRVTDPEWARREGMVAFAGYPLVAGEDLVGVVGLFARRRMSGTDLEVLASVADAIALAIALDRARAEGRRVDLLVAAAELLIADLQPDQVPDRVARLAVPALADLCVIDLQVGDGLFERAAAASAGPLADDLAAAMTVGRRMGFEEAPTVAAAVGAASAGGIVWTGRGEPAAEGAADLAAVSRRFGIHAQISLPVFRADQVVGALTLAYLSPDRHPGPAEVTAAQDLALATGVSLAISARAWHRSRLQQATAAFSRTFTRADVVEVVLNETRVASQATGVVLALTEGDGTTVRVAGALGYPDEVVAAWSSFPITSPAVLAQVIRERRPLHFSSPQERRRRWPDLDELATPAAASDSFAGYPLVFEGRVLGILGFSFSPARTLDPDQLAFLGDLAAQCALALERSERHHREHQVAEVLQRALLPRRLPRVPGLSLAARYLPATAGMRVGGDWYDAFGLPDGRAALVVGDVAGHDLTAAGMMGRLGAQFRGAAFVAGGPGAALTDLDRLLAHLDEGVMATLVYAVWDPAAATASVALAGHPPPVLIGRHGARLVGPAPGPPVGAAIQSVPYEDVTVDLSPGSALVMYTDGLVERRHAPLWEGLDALSAAAGRLHGLPAGDVLDALVGALLTGRHRDDDVALLACRAEARAAG